MPRRRKRNTRPNVRGKDAKNKFKVWNQDQRGRKVNAQQTDSGATRRLRRRSQRQTASVQDGTAPDSETVTREHDVAEPHIANTVTSSVNQPRNTSDSDPQDLPHDVLTNMSEPKTTNLSLPVSSHLTEEDRRQVDAFPRGEEPDSDAYMSLAEEGRRQVDALPWGEEPDSDTIAKAEKLFELISSGTGLAPYSQDTLRRLYRASADSLSGLLSN